MRRSILFFSGVCVGLSGAVFFQGIPVTAQGGGGAVVLQSGDANGDGDSEHGCRKPLADALELPRLMDLDPASAEFEAMCRKYANREIPERIVDLRGRGS